MIEIIETARCPCFADLLINLTTSCRTQRHSPKLIWMLLRTDVHLQDTMCCHTPSFHSVQVTGCALPDSVAITADGKMVVIACEGEPTDNGENEGPNKLENPEGMIGIVDVTYEEDGTFKVSAHASQHS